MGLNKNYSLDNRRHDVDYVALARKANSEFLVSLHTKQRGHAAEFVMRI